MKWSLRGFILVIAIIAVAVAAMAYEYWRGSGARQPAARTATVLIGGDIMFDRKVRALGEANGYDSLMAPIAPLVHSADIAIANLEGPVTDAPSQTLLPDGSYGTDLTFTFATVTPEAVAHAGFALVSLANNHSDNFGAEGLAETRQYLSAAGVGWFGDPENTGGTEAVRIIHGIAIAFVGYHEFEPGFERIVADVKRLRQAGDFVIVMPHWGVEYAAHPTDLQREQARELVAAGAGAVIGAHPHVIEDHEWIGDVPIYYSLGNLLFDQYFSPETMQGEMVELEIAGGSNAARVTGIRTFMISTASRKDVELVGEEGENGETGETGETGGTGYPL